MDKPSNLSESEWSTVLAVAASRLITMLLACAFVVTGFAAAIAGDFGGLCVCLAVAGVIACNGPALPPEISAKLAESE